MLDICSLCFPLSGTVLKKQSELQGLFASPNLSPYFEGLKGAGEIVQRLGARAVLQRS